MNPAKGFESCYLRLSGGPRIELMRTTRLAPIAIPPGAERMGLTHVAIALGSEQAVDDLTARIRTDGHPVLDGPRRTGDGYYEYESLVLDPDSNRIEFTA